MAWNGKDLTSQQLYEQISRGTKPDDVFSVSIRRLAERTAVSILISHGKCDIVYFGADSVALRRTTKGVSS